MFKTRGFGSFELYVSTMFDFTRDYAYKLMNATRIYDILKANYKPSELPGVETHCRPLTKIDNDADIIKIWDNVLKTGKIQGKVVIEMVNQFLGKGEKIETKTSETSETVTEQGDTVQDNENSADIRAEQQVRILEAKVTQLENDLEKARSDKGGIAKTKMAREMIQKGFASMATSITDDQKAELIATKKALLG